MDRASIDWRTQDWDDLVPRLLALALSRLRRAAWRGRFGEAPPGAAEAADFVNDAIAKTIDGQRVWNPAACTLFQHLAGVVVSDVSHAATSMENRSTSRVPTRPDDDGDDPPIDLADDAPDPEQAAQWRDEQRRLLAHLDAVDPELRHMAELMLLRDIQETVDLAAALDITATEVANRRKRLKRAVQAFRAEAVA